MTDKNDSRRKLLKSITAGAGAVVAGKAMPESWTKPAIDSVILPVHAQTTEDVDDGAPAPVLLVYGSDSEPLPRTGIGEWAGDSKSDPNRTPIWICVVMNANNTATITTQGSQNNGRRSGTVPSTLNTPGTISEISSCGDIDPQIVQFTNISPTSVTLQFYNDGQYPTYGYSITASVVPSCSAGSFPSVVC